MSIPLLTAPPAAPATNDPGTFDQRADALVAWQATHVSEMNVILPQIDTASQVAANAIIAVGAVEATLNTTKWAAGTNYNQGDRAWSPIDFLTYRRKVAGVSNTDPSLDQASWALVVDTRPTWSANTTNISVDVMLAVGGANVLNYTPTVSSLSVKLPDATGVKPGPAAYFIANQGTFALAVRDSAGNLLCVIRGGGYAVFALVDNSAAAGTWTATGYGIEFIRVVREKWATNAAGSGLAVGGRIALKITETLLVLVSRTGTTLVLQAVDLATQTLGLAVNVTGWTGSNAPVAMFAIGTTGGVIFSSGGGGSTCYGLAFTLAGITITAGVVSTTTFNNNQTVEANGGNGYGIAEAIAQIGGASGTQFFLPGSSLASPYNFAPRVATVTGTSIAYGNNQPVGATEPSAAIAAVKSFAIGANQVVAVVKSMGTSGYAARLLTIASTGAGATITETAATAWGGQSTITSPGSTQVTAVLQMGANEFWLLATYNTFNYIMRVTCTANTITRTESFVMSASGQSDGNYWNNFNLSLYHGLFQKIDATSAYVTALTPSGPVIAKVKWNAANGNFDITGNAGSTLGAQFGNAYVIKPAYVAGDGSGNGAYIMPFLGNLGGQGANGYADSCLGVYTWNNGSPKMTALVPAFALNMTNTPGYPDHELFFRNGKAYFFNTGTFALARVEGIAVDTRTGVVLSRQILDRSGAGTEYYRNYLSANNGAYAVAVENFGQYLSIYEVAK